MGRILPDVMTGHLADFPDELPHLRPFLQNFDITWARRRRAVGSDLSVYFLKPEAHMERAFGFESEILTVYSKYPEIQPRTIQAIEHFLSDDPARGRVDTMITFLIAEDEDPLPWAKQYMTSNPESRLIAAFSAKILRNRVGDSWAVRSLLSDQLYPRDLFNHQLPITSDYFFFGREELLFDLQNAFNRSENRGLFGLRKTGKTSVFFKLHRLVESHPQSLFIYIDCKLPSIRESDRHELLLRLAQDLATSAGTQLASSDQHPSDVFLAALRQVPSDRKIALVFDEIEYITHLSPSDEHWANDFIPFWQTIWHAQSLLGNLAIFIGGVNPTVVEQDLIDGVQNPLFGIVPYRYLSGLTIDELRRMLRTLGRPMGLRFDEESVAYIFAQYGGHPLLTRLACSTIHRQLREAAAPLPCPIDTSWLSATEPARVAELVFYCGHVVSELRLFYPDEYEIMTEIAQGHLADIFEFLADPMFTTHLNNYGLIGRDTTGRPTISIPVLEKYVRQQQAREKGLQTISDVQPQSDRPQWLESRKRQINDAIEELQRSIDRLRYPKLFGPNSYPMSHSFFAIDVADDGQKFAAFINTCNMCFVEAVEGYGNSIQKPQYFWREIQRQYPALSVALRRIKIYRHERVHIRLEERASDELKFFLTRDLNGRPPHTVDELWYRLQQCVLDDLLVGILVEVDRVT